MSLVEYAQNLPWLSYATHALGIALVWVIVWILVRYLGRWIANLDQHLEGFALDPREMKVLDRVLDYTIIVIGVVITLSILGVSEFLYSALTAAGVISIIIGFAVKDVAANVISGVFILLDQPFMPGDFVKIGDHSGTVDKISLRSTQLVTPDGPVITIPNNKMATEPTINYSMAATRRMEITVSVPKDSDMGQALQILHDVAQSESRLLEEKDFTLLVNDIGDYAVDLLLRCYAPKGIWEQVRSDLRRCIVEEFQRRGLELAVPVSKTRVPGQVGVRIVTPVARPGNDA
jgi:small conductance mechanosensitive channel